MIFYIYYVPLINMRVIINFILLLSLLIFSCAEEKKNTEFLSSNVVEPSFPIYLGIKLGGSSKEYTETLKSLAKTDRLSVLDNGVAYELNVYKNQNYILVPVVTTINERIDEVQFLAAAEKKDIGELIQNYKKNNYTMNISLKKKDKIRSGIIEKLSALYGLPESTDTTKSSNSLVGEMLEIKKIWLTPKEQILFTETYFAAGQGLEEGFSSMYITFKRNIF